MRPSIPREATVAVMQPYFYPYAGYFRLLVAADTFVVFDDVQFPRRGRVHRCEIPGPSATHRWLTLPLKHQPRETLIKDIAFARNARQHFDERLAEFAWLAKASGPLADRVRDHLYSPLNAPLDFIENGLRLLANALQLPARFVRSSSIAVERTLRGQDRVMAIVEAVGGRRYVNAPGGRKLCDPEAFRRRGMVLRFLTPYNSPHRSILPALVRDDPSALRADIVQTTQLVE